MKSLMIILTAVMLPFFTISAQKDQAAVKVLDRFSSKALNAPSVSMDFDIVTIDQSAGKTDTLSGSVLISGNRYQLTLPDNLIWFNGEISWSYLPAEKEVTISKPGKQDEIFMSKPSSVFTMYKKGYKIRLLEEKENAWIIDLYPEDFKSNLIHVRLTIDKSTLGLNNLEYKQKDGITKFVRIRNFDLSKKTETSIFNFPKEKFKGVEVIDMR
jgi:outer membrane lipoprotein-sorting protein